MPVQEIRIGLKGSARARISGADKIGPADSTERIEVTVRLRRGSDPG